MTVHDDALAALAETTPAAGAALAAAGINASGHPLPGLLGWLPDADLLDVVKACQLAHQTAGTPGFDGEPEQLAEAVKTGGTWRQPRGVTDVQRIDAAALAWGEAVGRNPELTRLSVRVVTSMGGRGVR